MYSFFEHFVVFVAVSYALFCSILKEVESVCEEDDDDGGEEEEKKRRRREKKREEKI